MAGGRNVSNSRQSSGRARGPPRSRPGRCQSFACAHWCRPTSRSQPVACEPGGGGALSSLELHGDDVALQQVDLLVAVRSRIVVHRLDLADHLGVRRHRGLEALRRALLRRHGRLRLWFTSQTMTARATASPCSGAGVVGTQAWRSSVCMFSYTNSPGYVRDSTLRQPVGSGCTAV